MIFINEQWQGGGDERVAEGVEEIKRLYLQGKVLACAPVSSETPVTKQNVIAYEPIRRQTIDALSLLRSMNQEKLFTIGGSCDADVATVEYLNEKYDGDLALVWLDAHGDINAPEESLTHLFYGMPIRALLGDGGPMMDHIVTRPLEPSQVVNFGGRCFDDAEVSYMKKMNIPSVPVDADAQALVEAIRATGRTHVHLHLDVDLLDPVHFPHVAVPIPGGLAPEKLPPLLRTLQKEVNVIGFSMYEFMPCGKPISLMPELVEFGESVVR